MHEGVNSSNEAPLKMAFDHFVKNIDFNDYNVKNATKSLRQNFYLILTK
jgi:hypothetical protein